MNIKKNSFIMCIFLLFMTLSLVPIQNQSTMAALPTRRREITAEPDEEPSDPYAVVVEEPFIFLNITQERGVPYAA